MTDDDAARIVNAFDSLIKAYRKAEEDTPGHELVLSTLRRSRFLWFHKLFVKFNPYTATPLVRHYVEAHIYEQADRIYKPLERLDTDYFVKNGTRPFKDACDLIAKYRDTTQGPWIPSILKYSMPGLLTAAAAYLWRHDTPLRTAVDGFLHQTKDLFMSSATTFAALFILSFGLIFLWQLIVSPQFHSFTRKRQIFRDNGIYKKENELLEQIRKYEPKARKKMEFPLDIVLSFAQVVPIGAFFIFLVLSIWDGLRFQNELVPYFSRMPDNLKHFPAGFTPPHTVWLFDGPFWVKGLAILMLTWMTVGSSIAWWGRVLAKQR